MDPAVFLAYQHRDMLGPEAIDEEEATNDDGSLNGDYIDAVFGDIDACGGVALVRGDDITPERIGPGVFHFHWPDTNHEHAFGEGLAEGEGIVACWQARRGEAVVGHVWAYSATTRTQ